MKRSVLAAVLLVCLLPPPGGGRSVEAPAMIPPGNAPSPPPASADGFQAVVADLTVCVSSGKTPPLGGSRDIHVRVMNNGPNDVRDLKLMFAVEDKGIQAHVISFLGSKQTYRRTRNHSWSTVGTKTIVAMVFKAGYKEQVKAEGSYRVRLAGTPSDSSGEGDKCASGIIRTPVDKPTADLTVCISDGHTPAINQHRDVHVWVRNNGSDKVEGITVTFYVEGKSIETRTIPSLSGRTTSKITRNPSWATVGTKSLSANVRIAGQTGLWSAFGAYKVRLPGTPSDSSGEGIKCSDGSKL